METDFSDEPGWFCDGSPHRAVQNQGSYCTGRPRRTVRYRKRRCGVRSPHYGAGKFAPSVSQKRKAVLEVRISEPPVAGILPRQSRKATPGGDAQAARRSGSEMSQTSMQRRRPAEACRAGLPLKGAVCGSRLGLKKRACAASAGVRGYARHKDSAEWLD